MLANIADSDSKRMMDAVNLTLLSKWAPDDSPEVNGLTHEGRSKTGQQVGLSIGTVFISQVVPSKKIP